ncbi:MAG: hypothetical protein ACFFDH_00335 [Promethearchaeota archaeon]
MNNNLIDCLKEHLEEIGKVSIAGIDDLSETMEALEKQGYIVEMSSDTDYLELIEIDKTKEMVYSDNEKEKDDIEKLHAKLSVIENINVSKLKEETYQERIEKEQIESLYSTLIDLHVKMGAGIYNIKNMCKIIAETEIKRKKKNERLIFVLCNDSKKFENYCYNNYKCSYNRYNNDYYFSPHRIEYKKVEVLYNSKKITIGNKRHDEELEDSEIINSKCDFIENGIYALKVSLLDMYSPIINPETSCEDEEIRYIIYNKNFKSCEEIVIQD